MNSPLLNIKTIEGATRITLVEKLGWNEKAAEAYKDAMNRKLSDLEKLIDVDQILNS